MNINQKGFANIALVLIIIAIVAVGGYFVLSKKSVTPSTATNQQTNNPVTPTAQDTTANWKTFNSIKDGNYKSGYLFTLRYPSMWYFETRTTKQGTADDQSTQFSDYSLSRGEEGILLTPIPKENCAVFVTVDYTGKYMDTSKQPFFASNNSYPDPAKKAACDSTIQQIKKSIFAEFTVQ